MDIIWTDYLKYRVGLRKFDLDRLEDIVKHSAERYFDMVTQRAVVVGRYDNKLVLIPYDRHGNEVTPVTVHVTTRQQIKFRLNTGRFRNE